MNKTCRKATWMLALLALSGVASGADEPNSATASRLHVQSLAGGAHLMTYEDFSKPLVDGRVLKAHRATSYGTADLESLPRLRYELQQAYVVNPDTEVAPVYFGDALMWVNQDSGAVQIVAEQMLVPAGWSPSERDSQSAARSGTVRFSCQGGKIQVNDIHSGRSNMCAGGAKVSCTDTAIKADYTDSC